MEEAGVFITKQIFGQMWLSPSSPLWTSQILIQCSSGFPTRHQLKKIHLWWVQKGIFLLFSGFNGNWMNFSSTEPFSVYSQRIWPGQRNQRRHHLQHWRLYSPPSGIMVSVVCMCSKRCCFPPHCLTGSTTEGLFKISSDDGVISVAGPIDREVTGDTVSLIVKVQLLFKFVLVLNGNWIGKKLNRYESTTRRCSLASC